MTHALVDKLLEFPHELLVLLAARHELLLVQLAVAVNVHLLEQLGGVRGGLLLRRRLGPLVVGGGEHDVDGAHHDGHLLLIDCPAFVHVIP